MCPQYQGHVFFIDDDLSDLKNIIKLIEDQGLTVKAVDDLGDAFVYLRSVKAKDIDVFVADLALAYGKTSKDQPETDIFTAAETGDGRFTGAILLSVIRNGERDLKIRKDVPAVFYTNVRGDPEVTRLADELEAEVSLKLSGGFLALWKMISKHLEIRDEESS